ncbi:MAG: glycosyltransferase family 39 protein [Candidatus Eremiobacteraeota bacterium]|nr:glycosyltransferase family 39 protein [Candidatus Eremiobacteraeota bacterium]MBC5804492.1 glycosyltransferase family 39 protein [Candidatus Eremiobacteraeota bacterium]
MLGIGFRYSNALHKIYYQDEAVTSLRLAGFTLHDYDQLFNRRPHTFGEIHRLVRPAPGRGVVDTVRSLASEDPQHPPAFYALAAVWVRAFGSTPLWTRLLAVGLSLTALPLMYALAFELFASRSVSLIATALLAVSPFFILYAYQAREYGLLSSAILLSSVLFLRAVRLGGARRWCWYALSLAFGMYTYLLFGLVIAAHAIAVIERARRNPRLLATFAAATCTGLMLAVPWLWIFLRNRSVANEDVSWATSAYPLPFMLAKWGFYATATFFDLEYAFARFAIFAALVAVIIVIASVHLVRRENSGAAIFVVSMGGLAFLALALPDMLLHHRFSTIARYLVPTWLAIVLTVAAFLGHWKRKQLAVATFALLLAGGVLSDAVSARSTSWWENNGNKAVPRVAAQLRKHPGLLLVSTQDEAPLLDLAPLVAADAKWLGYRAGTMPPPSSLTGEGRIYLLSPSTWLHGRLQADRNLRLRLVYDSHDFSTNLTRFRAASTGASAGTNDWGEMVLWTIEPRAPSRTPDRPQAFARLKAST